MLENIQSTPQLSNTLESNRHDAPQIRTQGSETSDGLRIGVVSHGIAHIMNANHAETDDRISRSNRHLEHRLTLLENQRQPLERLYARIDDSITCYGVHTTVRGTAKIFAGFVTICFIAWIGKLVRDVYYPLNDGNHLR